MKALKVTIGIVFAGLVTMAVFVGLLGLVFSGSSDGGTCDAKGCSTRAKAVEAAQKHRAARPGHPATGVCLEQGRDGWWEWSLTTAGCDYPAVWAPLG